MPSMPGSITSTMAASNGSDRASSRPSSPLDGEAHAVALARQQRLEDLAHDFFVVDDEDGAVACHAACLHLLRCRATAARPAPAETQREPRALPDAALAVDRAVVLADDAVGDRQAEAGALADRLGREERIVDARRGARSECRSRCRPPRRRRVPSSTRVATDSQPPFGIASRAFRNRFRNTCCSLCSTPSTTGACVGQLAADLDACRSRTGARAAPSTSLTTAFRSTGARSAVGWPV